MIRSKIRQEAVAAIRDIMQAATRLAKAEQEIRSRGGGLPSITDIPDQPVKPSLPEPRAERSIEDRDRGPTLLQAVRGLGGAA